MRIPDATTRDLRAAVKREVDAACNLSCRPSEPNVSTLTEGLRSSVAVRVALARMGDADGGGAEGAPEPDAEPIRPQAIDRSLNELRQSHLNSRARCRAHPRSSSLKATLFALECVCELVREARVMQCHCAIDVCAFSEAVGVHTRLNADTRPCLVQRSIEPGAIIAQEM